MTIASIDIGTNTVLLLVARISDDGAITPLAYEQRIPRLGRGVDARRKLGDDSMRRVVQALRELQSIAAPHCPQVTVVCGTSAVRDSANSDEFGALVRRETGLELEVLTGDEEALWTYRGAISGMRAVHRATVVDIGGGSTEITIGDASGVSSKASIDLGSVRLTERILRDDPPTPAQLAEATAWITSEIRNIHGFPVAGTVLIGVAGTATTLALLDQNLRSFRLESVSNYTLTLDAVTRLASRLSRLSVAAIRQLSDVLEGRADIISAGALILRELMAQLGFAQLTVSERGVRYGLILREWERRSGGR